VITAAGISHLCHGYIEDSVARKGVLKPPCFPLLAGGGYAIVLTDVSADPGLMMAPARPRSKAAFDGR